MVINILTKYYDALSLSFQPNSILYSLFFLPWNRPAKEGLDFLYNLYPGDIFIMSGFAVQSTHCTGVQKVNQLRPRLKNITIKVIVLEKMNETKNNSGVRIARFLIADETGIFLLICSLDVA